MDNGGILDRAAKRANDRISVFDPEPDGAFSVDAAAAAVMFAGTDLDGRDLVETAELMTAAVIERVRQGGEPRGVILGVVLSSVLLGYFAREEVERADDSA